MNFGNVLLVFCLIAVSLVSALPSTNTRIINGHIAQANQFPWHVAIRGRLNNGAETLCGGAFISQNFVLTTAACLFGSNYQTFFVQFGSTNRTSPLMTLEINPNEEGKRILHPSYTANGILNNLGLLQLPINLQSSERIAPIRLPALFQQHNLFFNANVTVSGFGRVAHIGNNSHALRFTESRVIQTSDCNAIFPLNFFDRNSDMFCTVGKELEVHGPCDNDQGGPLVLYEQNIPTLIGLHSFIHSAGCVSDRPTGFTRLGGYLQWIAQATGIPSRR